MAQVNLEGFRGELKASFKEEAAGSGLAEETACWPCSPGPAQEQGQCYPHTASLTLLPQIHHLGRSLSSHLQLPLIQLMLGLKWPSILLAPFVLAAIRLSQTLFISFCNGLLTGPQRLLFPFQPIPYNAARIIFLINLAMSLPFLKPSMAL